MEKGEKMMPLCLLKNGECGIIKKISGKDETRRHLAELGFVVDEKVTVISSVGGNMILDVKGSRIALGCDMAKRIMV